jgi:chromosome partitioning protein
MMLSSIFGNKSAPSNATSQPRLSGGHVIVLGNEKGGCGKTTTALHITAALLRLGFKVGSIDIDARQRSFTRYLENRKNTMTREGVPLPMPEHMVIQKSPFPNRGDAEADETQRFVTALTRLKQWNDFVVIDSPGSDTFLSRLAHSYADTIVTPINDSFVDLDVLATVDGGTAKVIKPSIYSEMVWEQKLIRAKRDGGAVDWIVMRNRLSNINAKNKLLMMQVLNELSKRIGFRPAHGFGERVIFREMFLQGLTVLDIMEAGNQVSMSHIAARQEVRDLLSVLRLPMVDTKIAQETRKSEAFENASEPADIVNAQDAPEIGEKTPEVAAG